MRISDWSSDVCSSDLIFFTHPLQEVEDVLLKATAVSTDRLASPHCGIVGVGGEGVVMTVRKTTISGAVHFAQDRLGVATLDAKRSEEHTSELQSLMRISYAVICLKKTNTISIQIPIHS